MRPVYRMMKMSILAAALAFVFAATAYAQMQIYVGNLSYNTSAEDLREFFSTYGDVDTVHIITDRETGRPRGFANVRMHNNFDKAIKGANGAILQGRPLTVREWKQTQGDTRGAGAGRGGGFGGGVQGEGAGQGGGYGPQRRGRW
jgi:uncharacterized membrane protein YgcG